MVDWQNRVELIQDFGFPEASYRLRSTADGQHLVATGVYKPQLRVYDLAQMSLKFERHTECENIQIQLLGDDWKKAVMLQADRSVEFHSQGGLHYKTRIPKFGRDMAYHAPSCDLVLGGQGNEAFRLNLDQGRFLAPFETLSPGLNVIKNNLANQLWMMGGEDGFVEFWDSRSRSRVGRNNCGLALMAQQGADSFSSMPEITAMGTMSDGLTYAVGTSSGQVMIYDFRSTKPMLTKDHQSDMPIKNVQFLTGEASNVLSADAKVIKIWNKDTAKLYASIEPESDINDVCVWDQSGLIMTANEGTRMNIFYLPSLGPAPKWCTFLDSLTEEMEENPQANVYDDYKFVTRSELANLGLEHMIGTPVLRAYMHGFYIDVRLYEKARAIANPFAYDDYRKKAIKAKLEEARQSRISATRRLPKVNTAVASRMLSKVKKQSVSGENNSITHENPLGDNRFADMFKDSSFQVDEQDPEYIKFHTKAHPKHREAALSQAAFDKVDDDSDRDMSSRASSNEFSDNEDSGMDSDQSEQLLERGSRKKQVATVKKQDVKKKSPTFFEIRENQVSNGWDRKKSGYGEDRKKKESFEKRLSKSSNRGGRSMQSSSGTGGAMTMKFNIRGGRGGSRGGSHGTSRGSRGRGGSSSTSTRGQSSAPFEQKSSGVSSRPARRSANGF